MSDIQTPTPKDDQTKPTSGDALEQTDGSPSRKDEVRNLADVKKTEQASGKPNDTPKLEGDEANFYTKSSQGGKLQGILDLFKRRKSLSIGTVVAILAISMLTATSLGPLRFIHMAEILQNFSFQDQEISMSHRLRNLVVYSQLARGKEGKLENTRLGTIDAFRAKKIDKKLAKSGLKMEYSRPGGRFERITLDLSKMPEDLKTELKGAKTDAERNAKIAEAFDIDVSSIERNGSTISVRADNDNAIRKIIDKSVEFTPDFKTKMQAVSARRILKKRTNMAEFNLPTVLEKYRPTKIRENIKSSLAERLQKMLDDRKVRLSSNIDTGGGAGSKMFKELQTKIITQLGQMSAETATGIGAVVAITQISCTIRDSADTIATIQTANKVMPMMQAATELMTVSSKIKAGEVDMAYLNWASDSYNNPKGVTDVSSIMEFIDSNGNLDDKAFEKSRMQETFARYPELNPDNTSNFQKTNDFIKDVENMYNNVQSFVPGSREIIFAINALPGTSKKIETSDLACGIVNLPSEFLSKISDIIGNNVPIYGLVQDKVQEWSNQLVGWIAGSAIDLTDPKYNGAPFQESVAMGFRYFSNEAALGAGGGLLSDQQETINNGLANEYKKQEDDRTFIARLFDIRDYKSPSAKIAMNVSSLATPANLAALPQQTMSSISSLFNKKAGAAVATSQVFYGVPKVGFDLEKIEKDAYANPYANAEIVYEQLSNDPDKKAHFTECTGMEITDDFDFDVKSHEDESSPVAMYQQPGYKEKCQDMETDETLYRAKLLALDTLTLKSYSCLEFDDQQACQELIPESSGESDDGGLPDGEFIWPLKTDIVINACFNEPLRKGPHPGIDLQTDMSTPIYAMASGTVVGQLGGEYAVIEIKHNDELYSVYEHLSRIDVKLGQKVEAGEQIGISGDTGSAGAPHLHFGFTKDVDVFTYAQMGEGKIINPLRYLNDNEDYKRCSAKPEIR